MTAEASGAVTAPLTQAPMAAKIATRLAAERRWPRAWLRADPAFITVASRAAKHYGFGAATSR
jgi:hypothetical protein